jgi:hypothetical protein
MQSTRSVRPFQVVSEYRPSGDQPAAIAELVSCAIVHPAVRELSRRLIAEARVDAQSDDAERREIADVVIDTPGSLAYTMSQTRRALVARRRRAAR